MLAVDGRWVWDFWIADDGDAYHLFYLSAPDSLGHETLRHRNARIDHAVSTDLVEWSLVGNVLAAQGGEADDATACWTGCVVPHEGRWTMFYTGSRFLPEAGPKSNIETVLAAHSTDLESWQRRSEAVSRADARWYEVMGSSEWPEEAWRDPWVERDGDRWVMYLTARANHGANDDRGVIGYAVSEDLETWHAQPPLSEPGSGFAHLEVPQSSRSMASGCSSSRAPLRPCRKKPGGRPHRRNLELAGRRARKTFRRIGGAAPARRVALLGSRRIRQAKPASTTRVPLGRRRPLRGRD